MTRPSVSRAAAVTVRSVTKAFGTHTVLAEVDLDVPAGSMTAVLGPSGSGKTTLLRILAGFEHPDAGTVTIGDQVASTASRQLNPAARRIGYVPQEGALFPHLNVAANIGFGLPRRQRQARVDELLKMTGLTDLAGRYPHQLSGGQQQRVALARALAPAPQVVLLDEPFSSLDAAMRAAVRRDVAGILEAAGTTSILVTHDQDEALSLADRVAIIHDGRVHQEGTPREVYTQPADATVAKFLGDANLIPGRLIGRDEVGDTANIGGDGAVTVETALGRLAATPAAGAFATDTDEALVLVRPEQVKIVPGGDAAVLSVDYYGHDALVTVGLGAGALERIVVRRTAGEVPSQGDRVNVSVSGPVVAWPARPRR